MWFPYLQLFSYYWQRSRWLICDILREQFVFRVCNSSDSLQRIISMLLPILCIYSRIYLLIRTCSNFKSSKDKSFKFVHLSILLPPFSSSVLLSALSQVHCHLLIMQVYIADTAWPLIIGYFLLFLDQFYSTKSKFSFFTYF